MADISLPATYVDGFHDKDAVLKMTYNPLGNTGMKPSVLSFGASSLGSVFRKTDNSESHQVVKYLIKNGINYVDVAPWYGHGKAETVLGEGLQGVPREAYYVTTKIGRYLPEVDKMFDFRAERTIQSVDESLQRLGLDYVDVIQIHDMEFAPDLDIIVNETLPALQKVKDSGKAKFIGITGYPLGNFKKVLERSTVQVDTVLTYCHACMNDNSLAEHLPYFKEKGVGVVNASPISMGLLTDRGPASWHPAKSDVKDTCAKAAAYCQEKGVDISRLALAFTLRQSIPTTLFSTASLVNAKKNLDGLYTPLTALEEQTSREVMDRFMKPLNNKNWEGEEVKEYWENLGRK
ncbi:L-galactose dehydrogenase-like [Mizuhopecten yessoensis]|uniref:L-galactose dehydrogenase n=1 Tax=Mizuhopecten yessoensis TaxID=6573 RepID=A0A210R344_MIZYE|nr:L-galactose dehydrogenase-like [Mizuhopecten yessoensis]OWF55500.1 L-galactose dehydrogenase [Mizuhopecten yessoensis]